MIINYELPKSEDYLNLRLETNMGGKSIAKIDLALKNSLFIVCLYEGDKLIGFGRIVGDGAITYTISDIMVSPKYQGRGYGGVILGQMDKYLEKNTDEDSFISLIANRPADKLYKKYKFEYLDENRLGMLRNQAWDK